MTKCCGKSDSAAKCKMAGEGGKACCEAGKSKEMKCEKKDSKCDMAKCRKQDGTTASGGMKGCCGAGAENATKVLKESH
jgi:hypothetical protein